MADRRPADREEPDQRAEPNPLHQRFIEMLLATIERDKYPSQQLLDLFESCMYGDDRAQLADALMDRISTQRYPSMAQLARVARLVG